MFEADNGDAWCVHRTPLTHEYRTCKVGIDFRQFILKVNHNWMDAMPCLGRCADRCTSYKARTPDELAARKQRIVELLGKAMTTTEHGGGRG